MPQQHLKMSIGGVTKCHETTQVCKQHPQTPSKVLGSPCPGL